jgi:hypothetical protein
LATFGMYWLPLECIGYLWNDAGRITYSLSGALAKWRKSTINIVTSACLSVHYPAWKHSAPNGWLFMKFHISVFFQNMSRKSTFY